jgi:hypothetical protein
MNISMINERGKDQWEHYIDTHPHAVAWQSYDWNNVVRKHYNVAFYPLAAYEQGNICGILPLYGVKSLLGKVSLISVPYAVAGGIVADSEDISARLLENAIALARQNNFSTITFKQYKVKIQGELRTDSNFYNRELNLSESKDRLWSNLSDTNKQKIEQTKGAQVHLEYPSQDASGFYKLLVRHHHDIGIPCVSKGWIQDLVSFKMYSIALLKQNNTPVAGTLVKEFKKTVSFPFTSLPDQSEQSTLYAYRLYWELISRFAADGMEIFHSGRIPVSDITNEYRLGWGGTKYNYYYQYYPGTTGPTEYTKKRGGKRELFASVWKKLPVGLTQIIGPHIVKQYP